MYHSIQVNQCRSIKRNGSLGPTGTTAPAPASVDLDQQTSHFVSITRSRSRSAPPTNLPSLLPSFVYRFTKHRIDLLLTPSRAVPISPNRGILPRKKSNCSAEKKIQLHGGFKTKIKVFNFFPMFT